MKLKILLLNIANVSAALICHNVIASDSRPNIIYIMADDHASSAISAYGSILKDVLPTPNIDRIANEGMRMTHTFCTNSICTPSRAAIMTGQYSQKNGVYTLADTLSTKLPSLATYMRAAGYQTALIGKWHLGSEPQGFDFYSVFPGQGTYFNPLFLEKNILKKDSDFVVDHKIEKGYSTDVITDKSLEWLRQRKSDQPFFLMCHYKAPHRNWQYAPRFEHIFDGVVIPEPDNLYDKYDGKGEYINHLTMSIENMDKSDLNSDIPTGLSRDEHRKVAYQLFIKKYLRCVAGIDDNVGRILRFLDENNLTDNTIVIYTSDQGFYLGEHGWFDKRMMFEEGSQMPFIIRYPKIIKRGQVNNDILLNIDFAPTILDFAGVCKPTGMQGESFRQNITAGCPKKEWRKSYYYRYWMHDDPAHHVPGHFGIRSTRYKLIFFYNQPLGRRGAGARTATPNWEFYDLKDDPKEMKNLYGNSKYIFIIKTMKEKLIQLRIKYEDTDQSNPEMVALLQKYWNI